MVQTGQTTDLSAVVVDHCLRFSQAMVEGDADTLELLLADDFTYTHKSAWVEPRAELIPSIRGGRKNTQMEFDEMTVRSYPGTAIVNGLAHMRVGPADNLMQFDSRFTAVLIELEQAWRLVLYHSTGVPEA